MSICKVEKALASSVMNFKANILDTAWRLYLFPCCVFMKSVFLAY